MTDLFENIETNIEKFNEMVKGDEATTMFFGTTKCLLKVRGKMIRREGDKTILEVTEVIVNNTDHEWKVGDEIETHHYITYFDESPSK